MRFLSRFFNGDEPKEDDLYIAVLRYGKEHLGEYTTPEDLFEVMKARGIKSPYLSSIEYFQRLFWESFEGLEAPTAAYLDRSNWVLNVDSYFRLLEYEELNEARRSSKLALRWAISAMALSAVLALASIIISSLALSLN